MGTGIRYKVKKYNWFFANYINLISSSAMDFVAYCATFFRATSSLSLLLIDSAVLFLFFIVNRIFFLLIAIFAIMTTPHLRRFLDSPSSTERINTEQNIQKSGNPSVCCKVKSTLTLLYTILFISLISPLSLRLYCYIDTKSMFKLLYNVNGGIF